MPKLGMRKGRSGGGKVSRAFNDAAADSTKSIAFDSVHDTSNAFNGDSGLGDNHNTAHLSSWGGMGK